MTNRRCSAEATVCAPLGSAVLLKSRLARYFVGFRLAPTPSRCPRRAAATKESRPRASRPTRRLFLDESFRRQRLDDMRPCPDPLHVALEFGADVNAGMSAPAENSEQIGIRHRELITHQICV